MFRSICFMLLISQVFASGNYQKSTYSPPSTSVMGPQKRDAKSIEQEILNWNREGVSIHNVTASGDKFVVKGAFTNRSDFQRFLSKLKGEEGAIPREVTVKESSSSFAGIKNYDFEVEVENAW